MAELTTWDLLAGVGYLLYLLIIGVALFVAMMAPARIIEQGVEAWRRWRDRRQGIG